MTFNYNGSFKEGGFIDLPVDSRVLNYGDGVFETMKYANGRINFWEDHYFRMMSAMRILRMEIPMSFSPEFLEEQIRETIHKNEVSTARIKLVVCRKEGGFYTPATNEVDYIITLSPLKSASYELNESGLEIDLFKDFYKQKSLLSNLKTTASVLYTIASVYRKENDLDECILLNDDKMVAEAISSNLFMVKGKTVYTPPLSDGCLKGVMRKNVLEILPKMGFEVREESISPFDLQKADELFLTNSIKGVQWVKKYRKKEFTNELCPVLVKRLNVEVAIG